MADIVVKTSVIAMDPSCQKINNGSMANAIMAAKDEILKTLGEK